MIIRVLAGVVGIGMAASAAVPADIASKLVEIGRGVCVPQTAAIYRPLQPNPPYAGVKITRDQSYGLDAMNVLDVFSPEKGGGNRPVLIYESGGAGNKIQGGPNGDVFYDNIMAWAVRNGMTGVNVQRKAGDPAWDGPAKDVAMVVKWVHENIAKHKGNPNRVFIWSQSAGNIPVSTYLGHPELYPAFGVGVKGAVLMSAPNFNIAPVVPSAPAGGRGGFGACGGPPVAGAAAAGARGGGGDGKAAAKGGDGKGKGGGGRGQVDPETQLARSNLPGLMKLKIPFFLASAELDPPGMTEFNETLKEQFCKAGHCPTVMVFKDHSHISEVMSPYTADDSVTGPILKWMKSVK